MIPQSSVVNVSKTLSYLLRHGAKNENVKITDQGWITIEDLVLYFRTRTDIKQITQADLYATVEGNDKKRFELSSDRLSMRAVQGHSMDSVQIDSFQELSVDNLPKQVYHGTYMKFKSAILKKGLSRMGRQHIHMCVGLPSSSHDVISGMRGSCDCYIVLDPTTIVKDLGLKFYRSTNGVILCPGNEAGVIPPEYLVFKSF